MLMLSVASLLSRCHEIEGLSIQQLAHHLDILIPKDPKKRKGFSGLLLERALGTTAGNKAIPDFHHLGIELKTIPINHLGKAAESTFVTSIALLTLYQETWATSQCFQKLRQVLWVPIEDCPTIPFEARRIGSPFLWSPSAQDEAILARDWNELATLLTTGRIEEVNAAMGEYLQVRPKGQNGLSLCYGFDEQGNKIQTLPRGFYLRSSFTTKLL